jgi:hypothetical protein
MDAQAPTLPAEALQALRQGQKIHAIRILREQRGLDLLAAKNVVEACIASDPWLKKQCNAAAGSRNASVGRIVTWVLVIIAAAVAWLKATGRF